MTKVIFLLVVSAERVGGGDDGRLGATADEVEVQHSLDRLLLLPPHDSLQEMHGTEVT